MKTPVLKNIRTAHHLSEETPAFTAILKFKGASYYVRNNGTGGCNDYSPPLSRELLEELDQWAAKTFLPIAECGGAVLPEPMPMSFETWTFSKAFAV